MSFYVSPFVLVSVFVKVTVATMCLETRKLIDRDPYYNVAYVSQYMIAWKTLNTSSVHLHISRKPKLEMVSKLCLKVSPIIVCFIFIL